MSEICFLFASSVLGHLLQFSSLRHVGGTESGKVYCVECIVFVLLRVSVGCTGVDLFFFLGRAVSLKLSGDVCETVVSFNSLFELLKEDHSVIFSVDLLMFSSLVVVC